MSLSSHVHHFAPFALYISIYDLVIFIDEGTRYGFCYLRRLFIFHSSLNIRIRD
jgi:hypothetical protein